MFSEGFVYRLGVGLKDCGERMARARVFGIPLLRWCCGAVTGLGLRVKGSVLGRPVARFYGGGKTA